jgi:hypothetical protein
MVQSHDPPSPEKGQDKRYYEHVMKDFHEQYDSVGQTSQYSDNGHEHTNIYNWWKTRQKTKNREKWHP